MPRQTGPVAPRGDLSLARAHWVARDTIAWSTPASPGAVYRLHFDADGAMRLGARGVEGGRSIVLTRDPAGMSPVILERFPHLRGLAALKVAAADLKRVPAILRGQVAVSASDGAGALLDATALQIPGVLDDLFAYRGPLGVTFEGGAPRLALWAPTARSVRLHLFADSKRATPDDRAAMAYDGATGVWSAAVSRDWVNKYYLFEVEVFVPSTGRVERSLVSDPYSVSLSTNGTRSQIVDLADPSLRPPGWDGLVKPPFEAPEDGVVYEMHLRDFSVRDETVPPDHRGTYLAFTHGGSNGMKHLRALAEAGLTHVHLLPVFDYGSVDEDRSRRKEPDFALLASHPPDSPKQQEAIAPIRDQDGFNWGYDPFHYTVPEGGYAADPDGSARILEFRRMVQSLNGAGLRLVMDVVYNHTFAGGQDAKSVLDRVVPGYYHRLNADGKIESSTCCANTASEHAMMERLMVDSVLTWARQYRVDGFRFDLMGHHMVSNMRKVRAALDGLTVERDGVDGKKIYLYGEGWNFGEVANGARGANATQANLAGTGIGTFNDRIRDALRGGRPFSGYREQGFATGLYFAPNGTEQGTREEQRDRLLHFADMIRVGMAGNLKDYRFVDSKGRTVTGAEVDYYGQPTGYASDPQESVQYVEAHDNETLFDAIALKAPQATTVDDRVRMQNLGVSVIALGQGAPFFHAGVDLLRSKSLDRDSFNSGDWFNKLDFTYATNNWGVGLPPAWANESNWPVMRALLADPALRPSPEHIRRAADHFREMLRVRKSSRLFRLRTAEEIRARVKFYNTGAKQLPGLIVMAVENSGPNRIDDPYDLVVVLVNASDRAQRFADAAFGGVPLVLHPILAASSDPAVRVSSYDASSAAFVVPARTTAVFVVQ
jgi:pullulanase